MTPCSAEAGPWRSSSGPGTRSSSCPPSAEADPCRQGPPVDRVDRGRGAAMKIRSVKANNRRRAFEVLAAGKRLVFPYARLLELRPTAEDPIARVYVDRELGAEGFTYALRSGQEGTVHVEDVLEYNQEPDHLRDLLLYRLTPQAPKRIAASPPAQRESVRR